MVALCRSEESGVVVVWSCGVRGVVGRGVCGGVVRGGVVWGA